MNILMTKDMGTEWTLYQVEDRDVVDFLSYATLSHQGVKDAPAYNRELVVLSSAQGDVYDEALSVANYVFDMDSGDFCYNNQIFPCYCTVDCNTASILVDYLPVYRVYAGSGDAREVDSEEFSDFSPFDYGVNVYAVGADEWIDWCKERLENYNFSHTADPSSFEISKLLNNLPSKDSWFMIFQPKEGWYSSERNYAYYRSRGELNPETFNCVFIGKGKRTLKDIYTAFSSCIPLEYKGFSLSRGGIVVLNRGYRDARAYYVDKTGYKDVSGFIDAYYEYNRDYVSIEGRGKVKVSELDLSEEYIATEPSDLYFTSVDVYSLDGVSKRKITTLLECDFKPYLAELGERTQRTYNVCSCIDDLLKVRAYSESTLCKDCMSRVLSVDEFLIYLDVDENLDTDGTPTTVGELREFLENNFPYRYSVYPATIDKAEELITEGGFYTIVFDGSEALIVGISSLFALDIRIRTGFAYEKRDKLAVITADRFIGVKPSTYGDNGCDYVIARFDGEILKGHVVNTSPYEVLCDIIKNIDSYGADIRGSVTDEAIMVPMCYTKFDEFLRASDGKGVAFSYDLCRELCENPALLKQVEDAVYLYLNGNYGDGDDMGAIGMYDMPDISLVIVFTGQVFVTIN